MIELNQIIHADCLNIMKHIPDKYFELAIVDPEYGINLNGPCGWFEKYGTLQKINENPPDENYFNELFRISQNRIIFGGNYFQLPPTRCFIVWDKGPTMRGRSFSECELIWTSFNKVARIFSESNRNHENTRFHPTQKPVALYRWLLINYAKPNDKIIDTHSGSGSLACACHLEKHDFLAIEKDYDYWLSSTKRLDEVRAQGVLF